LTAAQYIAEAEGYYGEYNPTVRKYVMAWFKARALSEDRISELWAETIKAVSSSYRTPPDVAALEAASKAAKARDDKRPELQRYLPEPAATDEDRELGGRFMARVMRCIAERKDPRDDNEIQEIMGVIDAQ
jgi:hypothetical protein